MSRQWTKKGTEEEGNKNRKTQKNKEKEKFLLVEIFSRHFAYYAAEGMFGVIAAARCNGSQGTFLSVSIVAARICGCSG
jgi:hypothetical protein